MRGTTPRYEEHKEPEPCAERQPSANSRRGVFSGVTVIERGQGGCDKIWHVPKPPETKYASSDGLSIAYQVSGAGPIDVVHVPGLVSHLEISREMPGPAHAFERYESYARLIRFDKRGTGLIGSSDRLSYSRGAHG